MKCQVNHRFCEVNTLHVESSCVRWVRARLNNCTQWSKSVARVVRPTLDGIVAALGRVVEDAGGTLADNTNGNEGTTIFAGIE